MDTKSRYYREMTLGRALILVLIGFEALNLAGILNFTLDFSWLGLLVTSVGALIALEGIYSFLKRKKAALSAFPYLLVAFGLWLDALGDVAHWYANFWWYDQFMHFTGGAIVMVVSLSILAKFREKLSLSGLFILLLALGIVALAGTLYEIEEYLEDQFYHGQQLRLGNGPDTADDLMWNLIGGLGASVIYFYSRKREGSKK